MTTQHRRPGRPTTASPTVAVASRRGVPRTQLAELFDVPATTVDAWRRAGCPRLPDGRFRPASVLAWLRRRDEAKAAAGAAKKQRGQWTELAAKALAMSRLHELDRRRAEFVPRAKVEEDWSRRCFAFRSASLALPRMLASRCGNVPPDVVEREAAAIVREMLAQFVKRGPTTPSPQHVAPEHPATKPTPPESNAGTSPATAGHHHHERRVS